MESNNFGIDSDRTTVFEVDDAIAQGLRLKPALQRARFGECVAELAHLAIDTRDAPRLLQEVPRMAAETLDVEHAAVHLLSTDRLSFQVAAGVGRRPGEKIDAHIANRPDTLAGLVVTEGQPRLVTASLREPVFVDAQLYRDAGLTSALAVPLFDCGRTVGVLAVWARDDRHFGVEEVRFLETLSSLLAARLQRVRTDEALSHSQGLKSVGQLTGGIAHDFNNLLTVISGNLQALEDLPAIAGDPETRQMLSDADVRAVAQNLLEVADCKATACASGEQAVALLAVHEAQDDRVPFDLLLTDIGLGTGLRGTDLAREVQRLWPAMPVLLVSGFTDEQLEAPMAWPLLHKPYSRTELPQAIAQALH